MYRCLLALNIMLSINSQLLCNGEDSDEDTPLQYPVFFRTSQISPILRGPSARFIEDDDPDEGGPCPPTHYGEIARQPWDVKGALSVTPTLPPTNTASKTTFNSVDSNCDDDSATLVIKVLFGSNDPCAKVKSQVIRKIRRASNGKFNPKSNWWYLQSSSKYPRIHLLK